MKKTSYNWKSWWLAERHRCRKVFSRGRENDRTQDEQDGTDSLPLSASFMTPYASGRVLHLRSYTQQQGRIGMAVHQGKSVSSECRCGRELVFPCAVFRTTGEQQAFQGIIKILQDNPIGILFLICGWSDHSALLIKVMKVPNMSCCHAQPVWRWSGSRWWCNSG